MAYTLKICNFNDYAMEFAPIKDGLYRSYLKFWYVNSQQNFIVDKFYDNVQSPNILGPQVCQKAKSEIQIPTTTSTFYMETLVQGNLQTSEPGAFCYAYAFNPIEFVYDYGDPPCVMTVSSFTMHINDRYSFTISQCLAVLFVTDRSTLRCCWRRFGRNVMWGLYWFDDRQHLP